MSSCWSHIDYLGPSVNINLLLSIIQGDAKRAASLSGQMEPKVLSNNPSDQLFVYLECSGYNSSFFPSEVLNVDNTLYHTMIWLTDTNHRIQNMFHKSINSRCVVVSIDQPQHVYGHFSYTYMPGTEHDETSEYRAVHGMWDHSWIDALQSLGDFPLSVVLTAMHAALIQMNSAVSLQVWGNEDLLEAPLFNSPCHFVPSSRRIVQNLTIEGMKRAIRRAVYLNKMHRQNLHKEYFESMKIDVKRRKQWWNEVFMSEIRESQTSVLTDEECVKDLMNSHYASCPYVFPFSDELMNRLYSLCRFRVSTGRLLIPSCNSYSFKDSLITW